MVRKIIIGRNASDMKRFGERGVLFLGKHYIKMGNTTSLSSEIYMDAVRSHVVLIVGKRGSGKSYSQSVITEGISGLEEDIKKNIAVLLIDTMGVFWTMKYENRKDSELLKEWGLEPKAFDVTIYTPIGFFKEAKERGIPTDYPFAIKPSELTSEDWCETFQLSQFSPAGILITKTIAELEGNFGLDDIINKVGEDLESEDKLKNVVKSMFIGTKAWGLFDKEGTKIKDIIKGGQVSILDVSAYATSPGGWQVKGLAIGLIAKKLFIERMVQRKKEELEMVKHGYSYLGEAEDSKEKSPLVWIVIDEAHEFLPHEGKNPATDALVTLLREGRQPGISLVLATQQPGKIHSDVLTQSDCVIAHKITAQKDIQALNEIMQSYMTKGLTEAVNDLPNEKGAAVILDDNVERLYPMRIRPKFSWHGGEAPTALKKSKKKLDLEI